MDELRDRFPLCVATGSPVCNKIEETRLEQTLTINQRVELKLKAGITPTVQEEMLTGKETSNYSKVYAMIKSNDKYNKD